MEQDESLAAKREDEVQQEAVAEVSPQKEESIIKLDDTAMKKQDESTLEINESSISIAADQIIEENYVQQLPIAEPQVVFPGDRRESNTQMEPSKSNINQGSSAL